MGTFVSNKASWEIPQHLNFWVRLSGSKPTGKRTWRKQLSRTQSRILGGGLEGVWAVWIRSMLKGLQNPKTGKTLQNQESLWETRKVLKPKEGTVNFVIN